uniref:Uncharacterized protein n=1 Tax=Nothobranchius furzeri TaxID=105023 RepID=A0A1A8AGN3_NOTFU
MSETQVAQTEKILCGGRGRTDRSGTNADKLFRLPINSLLRIRASEELVVAQSLEGRCGSVGRGRLTCCAPPAQPAAHGALGSVCRKSSGGIPVAVGEDASHVTPPAGPWDPCGGFWML